MNSLKSLIYGGLVALAAVGVTARSCSCVPAGHVRVLDTFGNVSERKLQPGINFPINPFSRRIAIDTRTKELKETISVPTNEGLMVNLEISVLYHANAEKSDSMYKTIGVDYEKVIVAPFLRNVARDVVADHSSEDLYGAARGKIASEIINTLAPDYSSRGIELENVLLRNVKLPDVVTNAIDTKMRMKQESEAMQYTITQEQGKADVKRAEAKGIADSQKKISGSLTPEYLEWKYISVIEALAKSHNDTVVIAPYDSKLLPYLPNEKDYSKPLPLKSPEKIEAPKK